MIPLSRFLCFLTPQPTLLALNCSQNLSFSSACSASLNPRQPLLTTLTKRLQFFEVRGMDKEFMHKNKLQDYAQKSAIPLPIYNTVNEGSPHAPQFRSSVIVDGSEFTSNCTFSKKIDAEQHVAKCALEAIKSFIRNNSSSLIPNNLVIFKCILNEYAVKMNFKLPTYETSKGSGSFPMFVSFVSFDNKTFKGEFGNSKKEAEQMGARAVIEFILGNSDSGIVMTEIIKSKAKSATVSKLNGSSSSEIANAVMIRPMVRQTNVNQLQMQNTPTWAPSTSFQLSYPEPPAAARLTKKARVDEVWASGPHAPH